MSKYTTIRELFDFLKKESSSLAWKSVEISLPEEESFTEEQLQTFLYELNEVSEKDFSDNWLNLFKYEVVKESADYALSSLHKEERARSTNRVFSKKKYAILMKFLEVK